MSTLTATREPATTGAAQSPGRWWALVVLALSQLMVVLDATIVNIALPTAQADLAFSDHARQWVVTAYALAFGSFGATPGAGAGRGLLLRRLLT